MGRTGGKIAGDDRTCDLGSNWHYGVRNTITKEPVQSPEDMKGLKIRVPGNQLQVDSMGALGAAGTPMSLGDVYTALQQGTIDGLENPIAVIENGKYQEVAKYLCEDAHIYDLTTWCCGDEFFSSLTEEQQELLMKTCEEAGVYNMRFWIQRPAKLYRGLRKPGLPFIRWTTLMSGWQHRSHFMMRQKKNMDGLMAL